MKKKIIYLICAFIFLEIVGCEVNKNEFDIGKVSDVEIIEKGVSSHLITSILHSCLFNVFDSQSYTVFIFQIIDDSGIGSGFRFSLK